MSVGPGVTRHSSTDVSELTVGQFCGYGTPVWLYISKASYCRHSLRGTFLFIHTAKILVQVIISLFHGSCNSLLAVLDKCSFATLVSILNTAAKIALLDYHSECAILLFIAFHCLPLFYYIKHKLLAFTFQVLHSLQPSSHLSFIVKILVVISVQPMRPTSISNLLNF